MSRHAPKKSRPGSIREWLSTGAGLASAAIALVALLVGSGTADKIITSPNSSPSITPKRHSPAPSGLVIALLPGKILGSVARVASSGNTLSPSPGICGDHGLGAAAMAYETIENHQTGMVLAESLTSYSTSIDAGQAIASYRLDIDRRGSCPSIISGVTQTVSGDYSGRPSTNCTQYFAAKIQGKSSSGYIAKEQCGTITISVRTESNVPGAVSQQTADGFLSSAATALKSWS